MLRSRLALTAIAALALGAASAPAATRPKLPPIVLVSRRPIPGHPERVPGLGPYARTAAPGGRLLVLEPGGAIRNLLPDGRFFDVSDPCISWDARRIVFAATVAPDSGWRIWSVGANGRQLRQLTRSDRAIDLSGYGAARERLERYDDFDPIWLPNGQVCFASTRFPMLSQSGDLPVSNLWTVSADGAHATRLTSERNGAEEPSVDPNTGRIVYARWWFNRWLPSERESSGITLDRAAAVPADTVNLWQAISILPNAEGMKLAGGDPRTRPTTMAYQPLVLKGGTMVGVWTTPLSLGAPASGDAGSGRPGIQIFPGGFSAPIRVGGGGSDTGGCAPAALPDGRLLVSLDPTGRGDYGLWVMRADGRSPKRLLDLPGTLELDAAALVARPRPPRASAPRQVPPDSLPIADPARLTDLIHTFRFDCLNVFANAALDAPFPSAVPMQRDVRIRFYATLARPREQGGDTAVLVREAKVTPSGGVHETDMPGDVPMFEQLVDAQGHVLRSAMGPAHVAGSNFAPITSGTKCVGCHVGHSAIFVPITYTNATWINASPSAEATASSSAPATAGAAGAVDRRTRGPAAEVGWIADGGAGEKLHLRWRWPIEVREMVLYPLHSNPQEGTDLQVLEAELVFSRNGREVFRTTLSGPLPAAGAHAKCNDVEVDAADIIMSRLAGRVLGREVAGLAEVETIARLVEK